ncbi:MAG: hypothetical protein GY953_02365, partial [bacterium]|nr:hypothetical protein [bacterium]
MIRHCQLLFAALTAAGCLWGQSSTQTTLLNPPRDADSVLVLRLGIGDKQQTTWDGSLRVTGGELVKLAGYEMRIGDFVHPPRRWEAATREAFSFQRRPHDEGYLVDMPEPVFLTPRFLLYLRGGDSTETAISTPQGDFTFRVSEIP